MEVTQSINSHESNPIHLNQSNNQQITSNQHHQNNLNSYSFPPSRAYSESILERNRDNSSPEVTRSESVGPTKAINNDQFDAQAPNNLNYHHHRNFSSSRSSNNGFGVELEPAPTEYSSLGKQIYSGRQNFSFSEYISDLTEDNNGGTSSVRMTLENHATMPYTPHPSLQPFPTRLHAPGLLLRRPDYSSPFPPSNFAVPLSAPQVHSYQWNTSSPCCNNPEPHSHSHFAPPPPPQHYSDHSRLHYPQNDQRLLTTQFPYPGSYYGNSPGLMRSTSNQSNISNQSNVSSHGHYQSVGERGNFSDSDLRQHSESPFQGSDNDQKPQYSGSGPDRNAFASSSSTPQHQHQHHNSLTSTQGTPSPAFYNNNISAGAGHYVYGNKPITTPSNNMMKSLDLNPPEPGKTPTGRIKKVGVVPGSGKNIFHPTPASMLAPNATLPRSINTKTGRSVPAPFPGTNSPGIPSNADFAKMPTKRSRGRRPPCSPELGAIKAEDITTISKEEQIKFSGTTKTGKPKKIFFCGVPGCGKCFKRSEHLKRHVRSIHTNEKRKFHVFYHSSRFSY